MSCERLESSLLEEDETKRCARPTAFPDVGSRGKPAKPRGMMIVVVRSWLFVEQIGMIETTLRRLQKLLLDFQLMVSCFGF